MQARTGTEVARTGNRQAERRRELHGRIATDLQSEFTQTAEDQRFWRITSPRPGKSRKLFDYWSKAGRCSIARSATAEAAIAGAW
jgi:hypothetical protein